MTERSNKKNRILAIMVTFTLALVMMLMSVGSVFAADNVDADGNKKAEKSKYDYIIKIYSGAQGKFSNGKVKTIKAKYGDSVTLSTDDLKVTNSEYYLRGIRQTGHDNDEIINSRTITVTGDMSYEAAYGIKGGMVGYTISYVDTNGKTLHPSDHYYGMVGDKPVVSYKYVDGYQPNAYNAKKTLSSDESKNVITFTYAKNTGTTAQNQNNNNNNNNNNQNNANANANANANGNNAAGANGDGTVDAGADAGDNGPEDIVDLDTPLADGSGDSTDIADSDTPEAGVSKPLMIGAGAAIVAAIAAAAVFMRRRREGEGEE